MSFASGLFSFAGGLSTGLREEIDLANQRKAAKAISDAEERTKQAELNEELRQFNITTDLTEKEIAIKESAQKTKEDTERRLGYEFKMTHKLKGKYFDFEKEKWHDTYTLQLDDYNLKKSDLKAKLDLAKNADERAETELSLKVLDQNWNQKQDEIQNQFNIDELDFKKYKVDVENDADMRKALEEASEGKVNFGEGLIFNKGSFETKDVSTAFLTWADDNLTKEKIDAIAKSNPEGITLLKTEFNNAVTNLIERSAKASATGDMISLVSSDQYMSAMAMSKYLGGVDLKEAVKQKTIDENPDADTALVEAEQTEDNTILVKGVPITYQNLAESNGFETAQELTDSLDSLVNITRKLEVNIIYDENLSPYESRETLISSLNNAGIPLSVLKLAPYVNNIQEASYDNINNATDYKELVEKAFEFGILTRDNNNTIQGESRLIDFIFMMQPKKEYTITSGLKQTSASTSPDGYGLKDTINQKDAKAQNDSSRTAIATAIKLKNVLNDPSSDKIGTALNIAALTYGITTQYEQLSSLWSGTRNNLRSSLRTGDGSSNKETGGISQAKQDEISKEIAKAQNTLNSSTSDDAKKKAKMTLLKFTLAYQVSMALQGGSGGRTISDQDVDNILQSLAMPDKFFSTATKESTTASLDTLVEFLESIELQSRYLAQYTMKGYRTYVAASEIINELNNVGGVGTDLEDFKKQMIERTGVGMTLTEEGGFDWGTEYTNNYRKTWSVDFTPNGAPIYVLVENGRINKKESYLMDETEWGNFLSTAQSNNNNVFDNSEPNFSMDIEKESYGGFRVKGLFSELVNQADDLGV